MPVSVLETSAFTEEAFVCVKTSRSDWDELYWAETPFKQVSNVTTWGCLSVCVHCWLCEVYSLCFAYSAAAERFILFVHLSVVCLLVAWCLETSSRSFVF